MTKIIFIRHGRTDYNEAEKFDCIWVASLTQDGKNQADNLVEIFKDENISAIYSSPFQRCVDTVRPLSEAKGIMITQDQAFMEIRAMMLQDQSFDCKKFKWANGYGDGEKIVEVDARVSNKIQSLLEKHAWETIVICGHWDTTFLGRNYFHNVDYDTQKYTSGLYLENNPEKYTIEAMYGIEESK